MLNFGTPKQATAPLRNKRVDKIVFRFARDESFPLQRMKYLFTEVRTVLDLGVNGLCLES